MAASSNAPPPRRSDNRPYGREERLAQRWTAPPVNVMLREEYEEKGELERDANNGRLSVYVFNFGEVARPTPHEPTMAHLTAHGAHVFLGQEVTEAMADMLHEAGWLLSDRQFIGAGRASGGNGLMIAARSQVAVEVVTHAEVSGSTKYYFQRRPEPYLSPYLFATVKLRWAFAAQFDYTFACFHLHYAVAKRGAHSSEFNEFISKLANGCRASGARFLCGDANMGLFLIVPAMQRAGFECRLLMHHREVDISSPLPAADPRASGFNSMRYDSLGVWSIGPLSDAGMKCLTLSSRLMLGALHPAVGEIAKRADRFKVLSRGYKLSSYMMPMTPEMPTQEDLDRVRLIWDLHKVELQDGSSAPAGTAGGTPWRTTSCWTLNRDTRADPQSYAHLEGAALITATAAPLLHFDGDRIKEALESGGCKIEYEWFAPIAPAGNRPYAYTQGLKPLPHIREIGLNWRKFDSQGRLWGLGGHFPLYFVIGCGRTRSGPGSVVRSVARKKTTWLKYNHSWPWWIAHESERHHWLPGDLFSGRGFSGYWWRHSRKGLSTHQREEKDWIWIQMYGREAYDAAVLATEPVLQLPYPPEQNPNSLSARAASGKPERWPWHVEELRGIPESREAREDHARSPAFPFTTEHATERVSRSAMLRSRTPMAPRS